MWVSFTNLIHYTISLKGQEFDILQKKKRLFNGKWLPIHTKKNLVFRQYIGRILFKNKFCLHLVFTFFQIISFCNCKIALIFWLAIIITLVAINKFCRKKYWNNKFLRKTYCQFIGFRLGASLFCIVLWISLQLMYSISLSFWKFLISEYVRDNLK